MRVIGLGTSALNFLLSPTYFVRCVLAGAVSQPRLLLSLKIILSGRFKSGPVDSAIITCLTQVHMCIISAKFLMRPIYAVQLLFEAAPKLANSGDGMANDVMFRQSESKD